MGSYSVVVHELAEFWSSEFADDPSASSDGVVVAGAADLWISLRLLSKIDKVIAPALGLKLEILGLEVNEFLSAF